MATGDKLVNLDVLKNTVQKEVVDLKSAMQYSAERNGMLRLKTAWVEGTINGTTGVDSSNNKTYRTGFISTEDADYVETTDSNGLCAVYYYTGTPTNPTYGYYHTSTQKFKVNKNFPLIRVTYWLSGYTELPDLNKVIVYRLPSDLLRKRLAVDVASLTFDIGGINTNGQNYDADTRIRSGYIANTPGTSTILYNNVNAMQVFEYDAEKRFLSPSTSWTNTHNISENAAYFRILIRKNAMNSTIADNEIMQLTAELDIARSLNDNVIAWKYDNSDFENLEDTIVTSDQLAKQGYYIMDYHNFTRSRCALASGNVGLSTASYRVSPDEITLDYDVTIHVDDGDYFVYGYKYVDSAWSYFDTQTNDVTIDKNTKFVFTIRKTDEDTSSTADVETFVSKVSFYSEPLLQVKKTKVPGVDILMANDDAVNKILASRWLRSATAKPLTLLWFSDIHRWEIPLYRIIEFKNYLISLGILDDTILTGDVVRDATDEGALFTKFWNDTPGTNDIMIALGNHDHYDVGGQPHGKATFAKMNEIFFKTVNDWNVTRESNYPFYYKDYADQNIRLIVADAAVTSDEADETTWLQNTLSGAKTLGYSVVIATHFLNTESVTIYNNDWSNNLARETGTDQMSYDWAECDIVSCVTDFIANGGKFLCYMIGHTHTDIVSYVTGHQDQLIINVACASDHRGNETALTTNDLPRYDDTRTQDCFNVITFDGVNGIVKCVRIGANINMYQQPRTAFAYNANTHQFISLV